MRTVWLRVQRKWIFSFGLFATVLLTIALARSQMLLGPLTHAFRSGGPLNHGQSVNECVNSVDCLTQIGGVAFGGIAVPADSSLRVAGLRYDSSRSDGSRLIVSLDNGEELVGDLPDWMLTPIARFAAGAQSACFTLFGDLTDPAEQTLATDNGYEILSYHPAFSNNLVGLRLFHADVLILAEASASLPTTNGNFLLGLGETAPDIPANKQALASLASYLEDPSGIQIFRSYLISDFQQQVSFQGHSGKLELDGWPLWYLWRFSVSDDELDVLSQQANDEAYATINAEFEADQQKLTNEDLANKYTDAYVAKRTRKLWDEILSSQVLQPLPTESAQLSNHIRDLGGINPVVYKALTSSMRYAAFFRYVQAVAPSLFDSFVQSLPCLLEPSLYTPTGYKAAEPMTMDSDSVPGPSTCGTGGNTAMGGSNSGGASSTLGGSSNGNTTPLAGATTTGGTSAPGSTDAFVTGGIASTGRDTFVVGTIGQGGDIASQGGTNSAVTSSSTLVATSGGIAGSGTSQGGTNSAGTSGSIMPDAVVGGQSANSLDTVTGGINGLEVGTESTGYAGDAKSTNNDSGGCGCRIGAQFAPNASWIFLALSTALYSRRKRRVKSAPNRRLTRP